MIKSDNIDKKKLYKNMQYIFFKQNNNYNNNNNKNS